MTHRTLDKLIADASLLGKTVALADATDPCMLEAARKATDRDIAQIKYIANEKEIKNAFKLHGKSNPQ